MKINVDKSKFGLDYRHPSYFAASQWQHDLNSVSLYYVVFRTILTLFSICNFLAYVSVTEMNVYFLIYLTHQGLIIVTVFDLLAYGLVIWQFLLVKKNGAPSQR